MATRGFIFWVRINKFVSLKRNENMLIEVKHGRVRVDMKATTGVIIAYESICNKPEL